jgi:hypothetical protein
VTAPSAARPSSIGVILRITRPGSSLRSASTSAASRIERNRDEAHLVAGLQSQQCAGTAGDMRIMQRVANFVRRSHRAPARRHVGGIKRLAWNAPPGYRRPRGRACKATHDELRQQRDAEVSALRQQHDGGVAALRQERDTEVAALRQEIAADRADRAEYSSRLGRLQEDNSALESLLADANDRLASYAVRIDDLEKQLAERDRMIIQRDSEAKPLHNEIAAAKRESDAGIERLQGDEHFLERLLQMEVR